MRAPTVDEIVEMALAYFAGKEEVSLTDEGLTTGDGRIFGLEPLRRRLAERPPSEWSQAVTEHFDLLLQVDPHMPATFEEASPNLRSAVIAEVDMGLFDGAIMERLLVDGLGERLMLRRGALGMTVTREAVDGWEVDTDSVWARARDASLWDEPVERCSFRPGNGLEYGALRGGRWTSTRVLAMERYLDPRAEYGALVAVPARDEILFHQIRDDRFAEAAVVMLSHAATSYAESPLPIGCDLFWWDSGTLARISTPAEDRYRYIRVPEFSAMLWRLEAATSRSCRR